jgi:Flp pilus assembly protein TadD
MVRPNVINGAVRPVFFLTLVVSSISFGLGVAGCGSQGPGKPTLARLELLVSNGKLADAEELCRKALQDRPNDAETRGALAMVLCLRGDAALAEAGYFSIEGIKADGTREPITSPKYAAARKFFESAAAEAREALTQTPRNGRIRGTLGLALYRTGQTETAVDELKLALKDEADSAEINNTLGLISYEAGRNDEALSYYQAALALDNTMPEVCYNLAVLYQGEFAKLGRSELRDAAVRYYQLYSRFSKGARDAEVERAVRELEGRGKAEGAPAAGRQG